VRILGERLQTNQKENIMNQAASIAPHASPCAKHEAINSSINNISGVEEALERLIERIKGLVPAEGDAKEIQPEIPSLDEFLCSASDRINSKLDHMHAQLSELNNLLF
jgi:hypothetical protein